MGTIRFDITESPGIVDYEPEADVSAYTIKEKVRNILKYGEKYALVYSAGEGYYTFPGGSIEPGEDPSQAALRETLEETGAEADGLRVVGITREFRRKDGRLQITYYFESEVKRLGEAHLTQEEAALGTVLSWVGQEDCASRLEAQDSTLYFRKFSGARDREMFRRYMKIMAG